MVPRLRELLFHCQRGKPAVALTASVGWILVLSTGLTVGADNEMQVHQVEGVKLTLRATKETFTADEMIFVAVVIQNTAEEPRLYSEGAPQVGFQFEVLGPDGRPVPTTRFSRHLRENYDSVDATLRELKSGEELTYSLNLSRRFDMSLRGRYSVSAKGRFRGGDPNTYVGVVSNALLLHVRGGEAY